MLKAFKTEIYPTQSQKQKINQSIGICRWLYNSYLAKNKELYELYKNNKIDKKNARVYLTYITGLILKLGMNLLGISMPDKM